MFSHDITCVLKGLYRMKKGMLFCLIGVLTFLLTGCVPEQKDSLNVGPDLTPNENVKYDFIQLHNDTVSIFEQYEQYAFITDCNIDGSNEDKVVTVTATCYDDVNAEIASHFAAALLRNINDAACVQDITLTASNSKDFGPLWEKYGFDLKIYTESEAAKEAPTPLYTLSIAAGQDSGLDPDIETYEEEWVRELEILQRNEE